LPREETPKKRGPAKKANKKYFTENKFFEGGIFWAKFFRGKKRQIQKIVRIQRGFKTEKFNSNFGQFQTNEGKSGAFGKISYNITKIGTSGKK
jgi:hypothetical protein